MDRCQFAVHPPVDGHWGLLSVAALLQSLLPVHWGGHPDVELLDHDSVVFNF